jgi:outer membrane protein OmpA-like peptidoglycan-associated protein
MAIKGNILILTILLPFFTLLGQNSPVAIEKNIVPNGSFENYRKKTGNIRQAIPWNQIASVDFYQKPLSDDTTAEKGAKDGDCYGGLRYQKKYKEFIQVKLTESLHRGSTYEFEMHIRLAYWSNAVLKSFGVLFSKAGYTGPGSATKANMIDSVCKKGGFSNNFKWIRIHGFYKADGGEKYITIGNFNPVIKKDLQRMNILKRGFKEAYYFIDDISLYRRKQPDEIIETVIVGPNKQNFEEDSVLKVNADIKIGDKVALKNIFFSPGSYYLLPESYVELNKLAQFLIRNPSISIQINGHSDNTGMKHKNQKMSEYRAREVFEYLIKKGVQNKMLFKGYGSTQPVASNETDDGKAKNRRVEFEIIKR